MLQDSPCAKRVQCFISEAAIPGYYLVLICCFCGILLQIIQMSGWCMIWFQN